MEQCALCISFGLREYNKEVLRLIKEEKLLLAGFTLGSVIDIIREGFRQCPPGILWKYIFGLLLRMEMLQRYCLKKNALMVAKTVEIVNRRRHVVALGISLFFSQAEETTQ